jgi:hypothetical protein
MFLALQLALEDSQREGGRQREATGQVWQPAMFCDDGRGNYRFRSAFLTSLICIVGRLSRSTSLPYTMRYDPAQDAKIQVSILFCHVLYLMCSVFVLITCFLRSMWFPFKSSLPLVDCLVHAPHDTTINEC